MTTNNITERAKSGKVDEEKDLKAFSIETDNIVM
jgi:hypothetical protein